MVLRWNQITFISWIGVLSVVAIVLSLIALLFLSLFQFNGAPPRELLIAAIESEAHFSLDSANLSGNARANMSFVGRFMFSLIIFMSGIAGNAAVPKISVSLRDRGAIVRVVLIAYCAVSVLYALVAAIGFFLYGDLTNVLIIDNFFLWPKGVLPFAVSLLVICNLWASFSILFSLVSDVFESVLRIELHCVGKRRALRLAMLALVFSASFLMRNDLAFIVTLGGVVGVLGSLALTLPLLIYLCLFWRHSTRPLSAGSKALHIGLLIVSVAIGMVAAYSDFKII